MIVFPFAALATLLAILLMFVFSLMVGRARGKYQVSAPHVTGHEMFERTYRVQMNTIEQFLLMGPALWIYAVFTDDIGAGVIGLIWIVGRIVYANSYMKDPKSRTAGFAITMLATLSLWLGGLYGVIDTLIH
jgi:glutathione S-transferase